MAEATNPITTASNPRVGRPETAPQWELLRHLAVAVDIIGDCDGVEPGTGNHDFVQDMRRFLDERSEALSQVDIDAVSAPSPEAGAGGSWQPMKDAPTGVPIIARHKPNDRMPDGWVATIKLGHRDDEADGCYDTILHYNGEESFRGFRGTWTGWLPVGSALPAGAGGDLGELERLSKAATQGEWKASGQRMGGDWIISTSERVVANCRPWSMRFDDDRNHADAALIVAAVAYVRDLIASGQGSAGIGDITDEAIQAALKAYHETHDTANVDDDPEDLDHAAMEAALYEAKKVRSGHLVASTPGQGAGDEKTGAVEDHVLRAMHRDGIVAADWTQFTHEQSLALLTKYLPAALRTLHAAGEVRHG